MSIPVTSTATVYCPIVVTYVIVSLAVAAGSSGSASAGRVPKLDALSAEGR